MGMSHSREFNSRDRIFMPPLKVGSIIFKKNIHNA
jgi:hypothetical protein